MSTCLIILFLSGLDPQNEDQWTEYIRKHHMKSYSTQARLWDKTRPDMLGEYAIEVDWAKSKWKEGIGQALYYSAITDRDPALILLIKNYDTDMKDCYKAIIACNKAKIKLFLFDCNKKQFIKK